MGRADELVSAGGGLIRWGTGRWRRFDRELLTTGDNAALV